MKHNNIFYMQVSREIWKYDISDKAKLLFFWLNELEQRYTGKQENLFFRTDAELADDMGWSLKTLKAAKAELRDTGLIRCGKMHLINKETKSRSKKHVTSYQIIK